MVSSYPQCRATNLDPRRVAAVRPFGRPTSALEDTTVQRPVGVTIFADHQHGDARGLVHNLRQPIVKARNAQQAFTGHMVKAGGPPIRKAARAEGHVMVVLTSQRRVLSVPNTPLQAPVDAGFRSRIAPA
jgi:hypothetical protein